jgi:hypothetical protein
MNRKVLVIAMALMAVAMLATPLFGTVSACGHRSWGRPTEKIPVAIGAPMDVPGPGYTLTLPEVSYCGNWQFGRGAIMDYPAYGVATEYGPWLVGGSSLWTGDYIVNLETKKGVFLWKVVITFPGGTYEDEEGEWGPIEVPSGTFKGCVILYGEFKLFPNGAAGHFNGYRYGVLWGTDEYRGWKLVISGETTNGVSDLEMYMYKPV